MENPAQSQVRLAQATDAHALARLHTDSWRTAYRGQLSDAYLDGPIFEDRLALWTRRLKQPDPHQHIWVLTQAGEVRALACVFANHDERWGALLENLHVAPALKRQGLGQQMLQTVRSWVAQHTAHPCLHLWVLQGNLAAQRFYLAQGAQQVEEGAWQAPDGSRVGQLRLAWGHSGIM
jgi:GNAT superfamily N-acetyltransferase